VEDWELATYYLLGATCNDCVYATIWPGEVWKGCDYRLARREAFEKGFFLPPKAHQICDQFMPIVGLGDEHALLNRDGSDRR
jgi:hypothetical protein